MKRLASVLACSLACLCAFAGVTSAFAQQKPDLAVEARNLSTPDICAEKDNIQIDFASPAVRSFRVQAIHPVYIGSIGVDRYAPDFSSCSFETHKYFGEDGARVTLYETPSLQLVAYKLPNFWRPARTPIRIGAKTYEGFDAAQLWVRHRERAEEVMVFYPPDGYWRIRPLPFGDMRWTAYGSSFLIGPVEVQERPVVDLAAIAFDPASKTFTLDFRRGGSAKVALQALDQDHISLDVSFDGAMPSGLPFATMRSMFATETNSDVARAAWLPKGADAWSEGSIMDFKKADVTEFWAGRRVPSRHNTSAPDMDFSLFSAGAAR
ncbi:MAG TPA: hypothetical protein PKA55_13890 [Rhodoblastus sp.]|nr:hypothetical protein [Rhodoblastus sp.]